MNIHQILEKVESASNRGLPGALSEKEFVALRAYVQRAEIAHEMVAECTDKLIQAVQLVHVPA